MSNSLPEEDHGYIKFTFAGNDDPEFTIETGFPQDMPVHQCIDLMAQMLFYVHSGSLTEQNAESILEACADLGHYEVGARIIQRWYQYEEDNAEDSVISPCIPPSTVFLPKRPF